MLMNELQYRNIEEALSELNALDKGRYFLCTCPECQHHEAFIYKNNLKMIQCNRENQCGERMMLQFVEKEGFKTLQENQKVYSDLTSEQVKDLHQLTSLLRYMQKYPMSPTLDKDYRGLSRDALRPFVADLRDSETVKKMFLNGKSLFMKDYDENTWMCKRNLIFPIYGEDGLVERLLLRSSLDPNMEPKEIQLSVNPSKDTRDFFIDVQRNSKVIVVTEAILDGAAFREVDSNVGLIALTGSAKTRKLKEYLIQNQNSSTLRDKSIILALDNDKAGEKASEEIIKTLKDIKANYEFFPFPRDIKDANEFLNDDKVKFNKIWREIKGKARQKNQQKDLIYER